MEGVGEHPGILVPAGVCCPSAPWPARPQHPCVQRRCSDPAPARQPSCVARTAPNQPCVCHPGRTAPLQGSLVLGGLAGSVLLLAQYTNTFQRPRRKRSSHSLHLAEHAAIMVSPLGLLGVLGGAARAQHRRARRAGMAGNAPSRATGTCAGTSAWWAWWVLQLHRDIACLARRHDAGTPFSLGRRPRPLPACGLSW